MLVRSMIRTINGVYQASVTTEVDSVDSVYIAAYGEPRVDTAGSIPYTSALTPPATAIAFDTAVDLPTVPAAGSAAVAPAVGPSSLSLAGSGTLTGATITANAGFFNGKLQVSGDFDIRVHLLSAPDTIDASAVDGYAIGLGAFDSLVAGAPATLVTWGGHHGAPRISHRRRTVAAAAATEVAGIDRASIAGIYLRLARTSGTMTAYYSLDNKVTWVPLGTSTSTLDTIAVGLFINSGSGVLQTALVSDALLQSVPVSGFTFTIVGGPNLRLIRSQSPHMFQLDGRLDPDAKAKVKGWVAEITTRIGAQKTLLFANPNVAATGVDGHETMQQL